MKIGRHNRRDFIAKISHGLIGAGLLNTMGLRASGNKQEGEKPKIIEYRRLGRTGLRVSDIGTGSPYSEQLLKATLESGVNFIETSESYYNGRNELIIGNVIKHFNRDELVIATKASPAYKVFKSADDIIRRADESLERLQTDYIDIYMIHQAQNVIKVGDRYFHRAIEKLKKSGKVRYTGLSCHGPTWGQGDRESLEDILMAAVRDGRFDVILLPYNFLNPEIGERILEACRQKNIGTMIMKSNPVVVYDNYEKMVSRGENIDRGDQRDYDQLKEQMKKAEGFFRRHGIEDIERMKEASIQFILSNSNVGTICCRFPTFSDINRYVSLSGTTLDEKSGSLLSEFREDLGFLNCRIGCNICEKVCPNNIPVSSIMRYNYYFISRGEERLSMDKYSELGVNNRDACKNCPGYCEQACRYGVLTRDLMCIAQNNLGIDRSHLA